MKQESEMLLTRIMESAKDSKILIFSKVPNPGPEELFWRLRISGQGTYIGPARLDEENVYLADPDTFIPEATLPNG